MTLLTLTVAACLAVAPQSDHILAGDLAPMFPALRQAPADAVIGFAPGAGASRTFNVSELARIAMRLGVKGAAPEDDICVERPVAPLSGEALLAAMRKILPQAQIEILDFDRIPAPAGEIEFRLSDLRPGPPDGVYWRGAVRYAGSRRFSIWAKVKTSVSATRVIAAGDIALGQPIAAGLIVARTEAVFPTSGEYASSPTDVIGKLARVEIRAGSPIRLQDLETPQDVMRGDTVKVIAQSGAARLEFDAVAEGSGSVGARVPIRNPSSNKIFLARVEAKDRVLVDTPTTKGIE